MAERNGGWAVFNDYKKDKPCAVCGEVFTPKSGVHKFCSTQCRGKWKYITGFASTANQYKEISGNWDRYLSRLLYVAGRKRDGLTRGDLQELLEKQNYKCALSGLPLTCNLELGKKFPYNASIDRIVAGGEYSRNNIQLVCKALNCWRADTDLDEFILMCEAVAEFQAKQRERGQDGY